MIAQLSNNELTICDSCNLTQIEMLPYKVTTFCLNMAVYRSQAGRVDSDMICICTDKNRLFFFAADVSTQRFIKETDGLLKDGINIGN